MPPKVIEVPGQGPVEFPESMSDDQIVAAIKANSPEPTLGQRAGRVAGLGARSLVRGATAIPTMMAEAVYQPAAAAGRAMGVPPIPGFELSPSAALEKTMTRAGLPQPESFGERLGTNIGSALTGAGTTQLALSAMRPISQAGEGIRQSFMQRPAMQGVSAGTGAASATTAGELGAGPAGQMAAGFAGSMVPFVPGMFKGTPSPESLQRNEILERGRQAGLVAPPQQMDPSVTNKLLGGFAGKAQTEQGASLKNQTVVNKLAREHVGLAPDARLSEGTLQQVRDIAYAPYREIAAISSSAKKYLEDLKQARFDANASYKWYARQPDPKVLKEAQAHAAEAERIENLFEKFSTSLNRPELVPQLRAAREKIAKTYDVDRALSQTGDVDPRILGNALDKGAPMTGPLRTVAEFQQASPRSMIPDINTQTPPGVSPLDYAAGGIMSAASGNYGMMGTVLGRPLARSLILSDPYQALMARPNLTNMPAGNAAGLGAIGGLLGNYSGQQPR